MRRTLGLVGLVGLLGIAVAGCGDDAPGSAPPWHDGVQAGTAATKLGGAQSPCQLPVTFDIPDKWKPARLEIGDLNQGGLDVVCEIDAKPAGAVGFIRVWVGPSAEPRQALEAFVADQTKVTDTQYRDTAVGQGSGAEATWLTEDTGRRRAFVMSTPLKTVLVTTGGIDDEEYQKMLPAFLLAKQSLVPLER